MLYEVRLRLIVTNAESPAEAEQIVFRALRMVPNIIAFAACTTEEMKSVSPKQ